MGFLCSMVVTVVLRNETHISIFGETSMRGNFDNISQATPTNVFCLQTSSLTYLLFSGEHFLSICIHCSVFVLYHLLRHYCSACTLLFVYPARAASTLSDILRLPQNVLCFPIVFLVFIFYYAIHVRLVLWLILSTVWMKREMKWKQINQCTDEPNFTYFISDFIVTEAKKNPIPNENMFVTDGVKPRNHVKQKLTYINHTHKVLCVWKRGWGVGISITTGLRDKKSPHS